MTRLDNVGIGRTILIEYEKCKKEPDTVVVHESVLRRPVYHYLVSHILINARLVPVQLRVEVKIAIL